MEIWKDIPYFEKYQVSNLGRLKSLKSGKAIIIKTYKQKNGYIQACFWANGKSNKKLLHRLVAEAFVPNPNGYNEINHLDENKENNVFTNLEWCEHSYNVNYGNCRIKISQKAKGRKLSKEHKEKLKIDSSNKRWLNNGVIESFAKKEKIDTLLKEGWQKGRLKGR